MEKGAHAEASLGAEIHVNVVLKPERSTGLVKVLSTLDGLDPAIHILLRRSLDVESLLNGRADQLEHVGFFDFEIINVGGAVFQRDCSQRFTDGVLQQTVSGQNRCEGCTNLLCFEVVHRVVLYNKPTILPVLNNMACKSATKEESDEALDIKAAK